MWYLSHLKLSARIAQLIRTLPHLSPVDQVYTAFEIVQCNKELETARNSRLLHIITNSTTPGKLN